MRVLLVEDDKAVRITVRHALEEAGHEVTPAADGEVALGAIDQQPFDLLLADIRLPGLDGIAVFHHFVRVQPAGAVIIISAHGDPDTAVEAMRAGAEDFITKPFELDELVLRIDRLADSRARRQQRAGCGDHHEAVQQLIGRAPAIVRLRERIKAAAAAGANVLITGETGTGKELVARTVHCLGRGTPRPFIHVNCASIPTELFEAEMFGHERGAFTGAVKRRQGRMAAARGGTLFLDEVGEMSLEHQGKLLRAVESGQVETVGGEPLRVTDVRLIAATNRNLPQMVAAGTFRQDLFYRLNVIELELPPLRERAADIPALVEHFLQQIAARRGQDAPPISPAAQAALSTYSYPGNVRELLHALEHGFALARGGEIEVEHLPSPFGASTPVLASRLNPLPLNDAVAQFEQVYIRRVLQQRDGRRGEAARALGISRKSLWQKLKKAYDETHGSGEGKKP